VTTTWDQLGGMTAGQITKAKNFETIGRQVQAMSIPGGGGPPDISMVTVGQAKTAQDFLHGARELITATLTGADYVREKNAKDAAQAADDAFPPE
jgi:hypothetical protein